MKPVPVPPMLSALVMSGLLAVDGYIFEELAGCPACGGEVTGYDYKVRNFVTLLDEGEERIIKVQVKRFSCRRCGKVSIAEAPFYPGIHLGAPVVDLCITLSASMPYNRASAVLRSMGIIVDRGTIRNYGSRDPGAVPVTQIYGFPLPLSLFSLSALAVGGQWGSVPRAEPVGGGLVPADRAPAEAFPVPEEGDERHNKNEEEERKTEGKQDRRQPR